MKCGKHDLPLDKHTVVHLRIYSMSTNFWKNKKQKVTPASRLSKNIFPKSAFIYVPRIAMYLLCTCIFLGRT